MLVNQGGFSYELIKLQGSRLKAQNHYVRWLNPEFFNAALHSRAIEKKKFDSHGHLGHVTPAKENNQGYYLAPCSALNNVRWKYQTKKKITTATAPKHVAGKVLGLKIKGSELRLFFQPTQMPTTEANNQDATLWECVGLAKVRH